MASRERKFRWKWRGEAIARQRGAVGGVGLMERSREATWWEEGAMLRRTTELMLEYMGNEGVGSEVIDRFMGLTTVDLRDERLGRARPHGMGKEKVSKNRCGKRRSKQAVSGDQRDARMATAAFREDEADE